jgi:hypothetical protein
VDASKKNIPKMVRVGELRKRKIKEANEKLNLVKEESFFETIFEKRFFDYSLGGYYHRERWASTRRYY